MTKFTLMALAATALIGFTAGSAQAANNEEGVSSYTIQQSLDGAAMNKKMPAAGGYDAYGSSEGTRFNHD